MEPVKGAAPCAALVELTRQIPTLPEYPSFVRRFTAGDMLVREAQPELLLAFVLEGSAKVFHAMENGRRLMHTLYRGNEVMGELELMLESPCMLTDICAVTDGALLVLEVSKCKERLLRDEHMLRFFARELAHKLDRSTRQGSDNLLYPLSARLASCILENAQGVCFHENLMRLSERLGTSYRHLLRTLRTLCERGALEKCEKGYHIRNALVLRELAGGLLEE